MTRIQLPAAANLSIAQFGDALRCHGFIIEQLTDDRLQAQAPPSVLSDVFPFERWFPAARVIIERSAAGFTISHRAPVRRIVVTGLASGLLLAATVPGTITTRLWLVAISVGVVSILHWRGARRQRTLLAVGATVGKSADDVP
jgi:hypothetical protein